MADTHILIEVLKPLIIEARILAVFPHLKNDIRSKLYKLYSIAFLILVATISSLPIYILYKNFDTARKVGDAQTTTLIFVQIMMTAIIFLTCLPLIYFVLNQGKKLNNILIILSKVCDDLQYEKAFYSKLRFYVRTYAVIVLPLYFINFIRESFTWKMVAAEIFEFNGYSLEATFIIRSLQFVVEVEMMVLVLAITFLIRLINEEIKVSIHFLQTFFYFFFLQINLRLQ
jgi:hypothetical protein